jgi:hypothetical protein
MLIAALAKEFFLSKETVMEIIKENADMIRDIRKALNELNFSAQVFISKYPHINWDAPQLEQYV